MAQLKRIKISHFKNIIKSEVDVDEAVTCLVGKNESGKTSFLEAVNRINPARSNAASEIDVQKQYPAWLEKRHRRQGKKVDDEKFAVADFELSDAEFAEFNDMFGSGALASKEFGVSVDYKKNRQWHFAINEAIILNNIIDTYNWTGIAASLPKDTVTRFSTEVAAAENIEEEKKIEIQKSLVTEFGKELNASEQILKRLRSLTPKFLYFSEFSQLPGTVDIQHILEADPKSLDDGELTAKTLLTLAGAANDYLKDPDYETRKRELENVSNDISREILSFWSTNTSLRMLVDTTQSTRNTNNGQTSVVKEFKFRIWDDSHQLSLGLEGRSSGFRWFFSFLAAFSEYEHSKEPLIILLDEPALGLHARAQKDFLRFIDERLAPRCQVIFTTHSPFMVQPGSLNRVRLVEDKGQEIGSVVSSDIMSTDRDTLFPLQGALGYDLVQHLLIGPHNLLVEGPSDHTFLILMSDLLIEKGRQGLNDRFSIVVAGGLDCIPSFVALLGTHLDVTVMIDSASQGHQRLESLTKQGILKSKRIIAVGEIINRKQADVEDLFADEDYLSLYNGAFKTKLKLNSKDSADRIVSRICRLEKIESFNHRRPADYFMRQRFEVSEKLTEDTLKNFETLFIALNKTI